MGQTQSLFFLSVLVFSIGGGWFIGRLGFKKAVFATLVFLTGGLLIVGSAQAFWVILVGAFCFGLAVSAIVVICSSLISDHFSEKRQSVFFLAGISDASGAIVGPAALGWWFTFSEVTNSSWRTGYYFTAGLVLALIIWASLIRFDELSDSKSRGEAGAAAFSIMKDILSKPTIYAIGFLGFLHGQAQGGAISFVGQLYQEKLKVNAAEAAFFISINSAGFFAGRFTLSWITARWKIPELLVLALCAAGGTFAFVATIVSPGYFFGLIFFFFAGAFISGNGPSISSFVGNRFAGQTATAFALFAGISSIGGAAGSYLIGFTGSRFGVGLSIFLVPIFSLTLAVTAFAWFLKDRSLSSIKMPAELVGSPSIGDQREVDRG